MDKKSKRIIYFIFSFVLLFLLFVPTHTAYAYFADSVSVDSGIELTLGTVDLSLVDAGNLENKNPIKIGKENPVANVQETIQNTGTLSGKLAYKISLTNSDGTPLNNELQQSIKLKLNDTDAKINSEYNVVTNPDGTPLSLTPTQSADIFIKMEVASLPKQTENIKVEIEFLLFQTNGSIDVPLFHDVESASYALEVEKKEEEIVVPPPAEENDDEYWPTTGWVDKGNILYNLEDYNPVMYYSEMVGSKKIKNLNDVIIYVETKDPEGIETTTSKDLTIQTPQGILIKAKYVNENKDHLKLTFSIDENSFTRIPFSVSMGYYRVASNGPNAPFELNSNGLPITLKRILLSTDDVKKPVGLIRSPRSINLFGEERKIYLAQSDQNEHNNLTIPLNNISLDDNVKTSINAQGKNKNAIQLGKKATGNPHFTLKPVKATDKTIADLQLSVLLEGNSGEILEVKRDVQILPTNLEVEWPAESYTETWVTQDLEGNYTTSKASSKLVKTQETYSSENMFIYIRNPDKEVLQFVLSNPTTFPVQSIDYNVSGDYMRVAFKYSGSNITIPTHSNSIVDGFTFTVNREIGGGLIYGQYLNVELFQ